MTEKADRLFTWNLNKLEFESFRELWGTHSQFVNRKLLFTFRWLMDSEDDRNFSLLHRAPFKHVLVLSINGLRRRRKSDKMRFCSSRESFNGASSKTHRIARNAQRKLRNRIIRFDQISAEEKIGQLLYAAGHMQTAIWTASIKHIQLQGWTGRFEYPFEFLLKNAIVKIRSL